MAVVLYNGEREELCDPASVPHLLENGWTAEPVKAEVKTKKARKVKTEEKVNVDKD